MSKLKYYDGANWNIVDGQINGDTLPIGAIMPYPSATAPTNWLSCDGSAVSRTVYSELFAIIGTTFGSGDGTTTFNLPNLKGKVVVGQNTSDTDFDTIGEIGGEKTHTLTINEIPEHSHNMVWDTGQNPGESAITWTSSTLTQFVNTRSTGGGQAHNNLQPYIVTNYIIKTKQSVGLIGNVVNQTTTSSIDTYSCNVINNKLDKTSVKTEETTSSTDTYSCNYINGVTEKNIISTRISEDVTLSGSYTELNNLTQDFVIGDKLSISNGRVLVRNSGVVSIKATLGIYNATNTRIYAYLRKNEANTGVWVVKDINSEYNSIVINQNISVSANDVLSIAIFSSTTASLESGKTCYDVEFI